MDYRDGLMIAFLALCAAGAHLAAMRIGMHLDLAAGRDPASPPKPPRRRAGEALEFDFPAELEAALAFYFGQVHSLLCDGAQLGAPLWPSLPKGKRQMTAHGIYRASPRPVTPHMFRDAAATCMAEMRPSTP
jgi:hypothetical protein